MRKAAALLRKALLLLSGNAAAAVLTLARNLVLARMLPVADYGIASTFALTMAVVEMASALGLQQQIVQSKDGDDPRYQAALQGFQVLRGAFSSLVLFLIAGPMADFLGIPQVTWAYQVLAVMPVLNAMVHFDIYRMQRRMRFGPGLLTSTVPALLSLVLVWPLVAMFGDWRVMLWAIMAQGLATVLLTHLVAERPYRLVLDRAVIAGSLRFGWPLLANAVLLFLVFNGEKLIVGRELGMAALGLFAMGVTLTLTPTLVAAKSVQSFFLPQLSRAVERDDASLRHLAIVTAQAAVLNGTTMALVVALVGEAFVLAVLGPKYAPLLPLLAGLAAVHALRIFKSGPSVVALALGKTGNALLGNLFRVVALPVAWAVLIGGGTLEQVIWIAIAAEACGFVAVLLLLDMRGVRILRPMLLPVATAIGFLAVVLVIQGFALVEGVAWTPLWATGILLATFGLHLVALRDLRRFAVHQFKR